MRPSVPISEGVHVRRGAGDLDYLHVGAASGSAVLCLQGAQLLEYRSARSAAPLLWVSEAAEYRQGRPLRGGIPICWPWFGPHPDDASAPSHGYARITPWTLHASERVGDAVALELRMAAPDAGLRPWRAELELRVEVGESLRLLLRTRNLEARPMRTSEALHAYLQVGDVRRVRLQGLDGAAFVDKLDAMRGGVHHGELHFDGPVDRMFVGTTSACVVEDPVLRRSIRVSKQGSASTVVWNPWQDAAAGMRDMRGDGWGRMLCVEAGNVERDQLMLAPGAEHVLGTRYELLDA
ncbi:D-hexose-6-phosphate mutarotase [Thiomonas sp. FB-6]|uniref:D-hexose-6-phosphate mutarotase n=1 Tax=Thiomonas sp. FB-6 TaxID=1158291 RepID=UPI00035CA25E|nr:D-hexose-6-phosphate mutarotase [Thiomonas sp. FB-6]